MADSERAKPDQVIGDYRLLGFLGEGAAGEVHLAVPRNPKLFAKTDDLVAVKLYKSDILAKHAELDRIKREFEVGSTVVHPNLARIYEYGEESELGRPFLVMEYIEGFTLGSWIPLFQPIPSRLVVYLLAQIVGAVSALHKSDLIHRDIKPPNVMLMPTFETKLLDYGVVKVTKDTRITREDEFVGTIRNASPEMLFGRSYDNRTDTYSIGTVLYALLHGKEVFAEENQFVRLAKLVTETSPYFDESIAARDDTSAKLLQLTKDLLTHDVDRRPAIEELFERVETIKGVAPKLDPSDLLHAYVATALSNLPQDAREATAFASSLIAEVAKRHDIYAYQPRRATDPVLHQDVDPPTVHLLDRRRVAAADVLFLLANNASHGVGQEMEIAASYNKPTILIARKGTDISRMLRGSFGNILDEISYVTPEDFDAKLSNSLAKHLPSIRQAKMTAKRITGLKIGARLGELRQERGYGSVRELAQAIGMSERTLSSLESGELDNPSLYVLAHIARGLQVTIADLLGHTLVTPIGAPDDQNLRTLERYAKQQANLSATDYLELRDEYLRQVAAKGEPARLTEDDWFQRFRALEERHYRERGQTGKSQPDQGRLDI